MREMVFNHASSVCEEFARDQLVESLVGMAKAMSFIVSHKLCVPELRAYESLVTVKVATLSLWDVLVDMLRSRRYADEVTFLMGVAHRAPLLEGVNEDISLKYYSISFDGPEELGSSLAYCAVSGGISVSLETSLRWATSILDVELVVLSDDAELERRTDQVDNVFNELSSAQVKNRALLLQAKNCSSRDFWGQKEQIVPKLVFGLDVEDQLARLDERSFQLVLQRLLELDAAASEWSEMGGAAPQYRSRVTPESEGTMRNPALVSARTFRNSLGAPQIYEWHARFGGGGRIHLFANSVPRVVEIGYIGPHLPL